MGGSCVWEHVFQRFLAIYTEDFDAAKKINYFKPRRIRGYQRRSLEKRISMRNLAVKVGGVHQIFGKVLSESVLLILGGPAGGEALERASPPRVSNII